MTRPSSGQPDNGQFASGSEDDETALVRRRIGRELQSLRQKSRMSLEAAGKASGLSRSFISMVENGTTGIEVSRLIRLANTYGVFVADLIAGAQSIVRPEFVRRDKGLRVPQLPPDAGVEYLGSPSWPIQPFRVTLVPGARLESLEHPGAEFIHCVEGRPTLIVGGEPYEMRPGDSVIIPDRMSHTYRNEHDAPAQLVGCVERHEQQAAEERSRGPRRASTS